MRRLARFLAVALLTASLRVAAAADIFADPAPAGRDESVEVMHFQLEALRTAPSDPAIPVGYGGGLGLSALGFSGEGWGPATELALAVGYISASGLMADGKLGLGPGFGAGGFRFAPVLGLGGGGLGLLAPAVSDRFLSTLGFRLYGGVITRFAFGDFAVSANGSYQYVTSRPRELRAGLRFEYLKYSLAFEWTDFGGQGSLAKLCFGLR